MAAACKGARGLREQLCACMGGGVQSSHHHAHSCHNSASPGPPPVSSPTRRAGDNDGYPAFQCGVAACLVGLSAGYARKKAMRGSTQQKVADECNRAINERLNQHHVTMESALRVLHWDRAAGNPGPPRAACSLRRPAGEG